MKNRWLSIEEIEYYLGINHDTVYRWVNKKIASESDGASLEISQGRHVFVGEIWGHLIGRSIGSGIIKPNILS